MWKRWIALVLCLCLFPVTVWSEDVFSTTFHLSFEMDPGAYPEYDYETVKPLAEMLNMLTLEGTLLTQAERFHLDADLLLNHSERTRTAFSVHGDKTLWMLRSPLLGTDTLSISMLPLLEFAIKVYSHMEIPLQRAAIFVSPYVHESGLMPVWQAAAPYLSQAKAQGHLSYEDVCMMAADVAEIAASNREFTYWVKAMLMETGYDDMLLYTMAMLEDWVISFVPPETGIVIETTDQPVSGERWMAGEALLFEHLTLDDGQQRLQLQLPRTLLGTLSATASWYETAGLLHLDITVSMLDDDGTRLLDLQGSGQLPYALPLQQPFRFSWSAGGSMVGTDDIHLLFEGEPNNEGFVLRQLDAYGERTMFTLTAQVRTESGSTLPVWEADYVDVITISTDELNALVGRIALPAAVGLLPLLVEIPNSTMQELMNLLDNSGIFGMLIDGFSVEDEDSGDGDFWDDEELYDDGILDNSDEAYEIIW